MPLQQGSARLRQRTVLLLGIAVLLAALIVAVVLASVLTHGRHEVSPKMLKWQDKGTTKNLQEVILGRCYNFITAQRPELGSAPAAQRGPVSSDRGGSWNKLMFVSFAGFLFRFALVF